MKKLSLLAFLSALSLSPAAQACLSCGCGSTGSAADLGAIGGAASLFADDQRWLIQSGASFRQVTGSFNEQGQWFETPADSLLQSYQALLGVMYFPVPGLSLGLQLPVQGNLLSGVSWGNFGSLMPTDRPAALGAGLGDLQLQASYRFWGWEEGALAAWGSASLPTGRLDPALPEAATGSGQTGLSGGMMLLYRPLQPVIDLSRHDLHTWWQGLIWEAFANLGYAQTLGEPPTGMSPFFQGQSLMYQLQGNVAFAPGWIAGLGLNGQLGSWQAGAGRQQLASRVKVVPSLQYEFNLSQGLRFAVGYDLPVFGANSLTDTSLYLVYYQFFK